MNCSLSHKVQHQSRVHSRLYIAFSLADREDRQNEVLSQQRSRHCSAPTRTLQTTAAKLGSVPRLFCLRFHRRYLHSSPTFVHPCARRSLRGCKFSPSLQQTPPEAMMFHAQIWKRCFDIIQLERPSASAGATSMLQLFLLIFGAA